MLMNKIAGKKLVGRFMIVAAAMLSLGMVDRAVAQPLIDQVPDEAMIYFGWRGTADPGPGYSTSEFKSLLDDSHARAIFDEVLPRVTTQLGRYGGPEAKEAVDAVRILAPAMWKYPSAFYASVITTGAPQPLPHVALYIKAGADAVNVQHTIDALLRRAGNSEVPVRSGLVGDIVVVSVGFDEASQAAAGGDVKALGKRSEFINSLAKCGSGATQNPADAMATFYVDGEAILGFVDKMISQSHDQQVAEHWPKIREALGVGGFHRLIVTAGFEGKQWAERSFVEAPLPRTGLIGMFDAPAFTEAELKVVPSSALSFATASFDLAKFITDARATTAQIDPDAGVKFDQALSLVQMYVGKNLVRDILEPLGQHWIMYSDPKIAGLGFASTVLVNKLDDPAKAAQGLSSLAIAINNTVNGQLQGKPFEVAFRQAKFGDLTVNYLAVPIFAPSWAIKDGMMYVGLYPQSVAAAVARGNGGTSVLEKPEYVAMKKALAVPSPGGVSFVDLPRTAPQAYSNALLMTRIFVGAFDIFGGRSPEPIVPPLDVLMKHVSPSGSASWSDESGFYSKSLSPFPGADILNSGGVDSLGPIFQVIGAMGSMAGQHR